MDFRESDPPGVVSDGSAVHKAKGRAEGQSGQSTHARERNTPGFVQQAVAMILGAIWEEDFADESVGYRPGRGARETVLGLRARGTQRRGLPMGRRGGHPGVFLRQMVEPAEPAEILWLAGVH